jgi:uncharacterized protein (TIGR02996 family)
MFPRELMMDDAFLADIVEHPDDDTPRLVYADWLEDHGEEAQAEFIRVRCELARLGVVEGAAHASVAMAWVASRQQLDGREEAGTPRGVPEAEFAAGGNPESIARLTIPITQGS